MARIPFTPTNTSIKRIETSPSAEPCHEQIVINNAYEDVMLSEKQLKFEKPLLSQ